MKLQKGQSQLSCQSYTVCDPCLVMFMDWLDKIVMSDSIKSWKKVSGKAGRPGKKMVRMQCEAVYNNAVCLVSHENLYDVRARPVFLDSSGL